MQIIANYHVQIIHVQFNLEMLSGDAKALHTTHRSSGVDVSDPSLSEAWDY